MITRKNLLILSLGFFIFFGTAAVGAKTSVNLSVNQSEVKLGKSIKLQLEVNTDQELYGDTEVRWLDNENILRQVDSYWEYTRECSACGIPSSPLHGDLNGEKIYTPKRTGFYQVYASYGSTQERGSAKVNFTVYRSSPTTTLSETTTTTTTLPSITTTTLSETTTTTTTTTTSTTSTTTTLPNTTTDINPKEQPLPMIYLIIAIIAIILIIAVLYHTFG